MSAVARKPKRNRPCRAELLRLAELDPTRWGDVCVAIAQFEGWEAFPDRRWCINLVRQRINARLSKAASRSFDLDWVDIVIDHFPESDLATRWMRRTARSEVRREANIAAA